jgi:hypothetical protein
MATGLRRAACFARRVISAMPRRLWRWRKAARHGTVSFPSSFAPPLPARVCFPRCSCSLCGCPCSSLPCFWRPAVCVGAALPCSPVPSSRRRLPWRVARGSLWRLPPRPPPRSSRPRRLRFAPPHSPPRSHCPLFLLSLSGPATPTTTHICAPPKQTPRPCNAAALRPFNSTIVPFPNHEGAATPQATRTFSKRQQSPNIWRRRKSAELLPKDARGRWLNPFGFAVQTHVTRAKGSQL